jgi:DNA-directed RNA polymerase specialized sigma24 family protein
MTPTLLENMLIREEMAILLMEISKLPTQQQSVIIATLNGVSVVEYAELTKRKFNTVKSTYNHGCMALAKAMKEL